MIECHPLLRPIVQLAKPVVHAVKAVHPRIVGVRHHVYHHIHRVMAAATPPQAVMTVCQRVAGPIVAGGLVLLPPASAVPPAGGVGGFPGAIVPEYGAPAFAPGFAGGGVNPYGPGAGYGPGALGLGGILAPAAAFPAVVASNVPVTTPATSVPVLVTSTSPPATTTVTTPGTSTPNTPDTPTTPTSTPPGTDTPPGNTTPGGPTPPPDGTPPGNSTPPTDTPEPASIAVLAGALGIAVFFRARAARRSRRD
jgi:hypothetical protein